MNQDGFIPAYLVKSKIKREFKFKKFVNSINFVNAVADLAESEGHHPDIFINFNTVKLILTTHAIKGLSENDFIGECFGP